jgi:hypothetical protein
MRKTSKLRNLYAYLLVFVMSLTLTSAVALVVAALTVFNPQQFAKSVAYVNYDARSAQMAKQEAVEIGLLYGVGEEFVSSIDFISYAQQCVTIPYRESVAELTSIQTALFHQDVSDALQQYAMTQGLSLTQEVLSGIDEMSQEVVDAFQAAVSIPLHQSFFTLTVSFNKIVYPVIILLLFILLIQQQILFRLDRRNHHRNMAYVSVMTGWLLILAPLGVLLSGAYRQIMIYPDYFRDLLIRHFEVTLWGSVISGGLLMMIGGIWFAAYLRTSKPRL